MLYGGKLGTQKEREHYMQNESTLYGVLSALQNESTLYGVVGIALTGGGRYLYLVLGSERTLYRSGFRSHTCKKLLPKVVAAAPTAALTFNERRGSVAFGQAYLNLPKRKKILSNKTACESWLRQGVQEKRSLCRETRVSSRCMLCITHSLP